MSLPLSNTTCDIYRNANAPPAAPDVAGVPCHLAPAYAKGLEAGEGDAAAFRFTHIMLAASAVDIRDGYAFGVISAAAFDHVWVPDRNGVKLDVVFVESQSRGTPGDHKKVYLQRQTPPWPTSNL